MTLAVILKLLKDHWRVAATVLGILILLVSVVLFVHNCRSLLERKIESNDPVVIESEQSANHAVNAAVNANANANAAMETANRAQENVNKVTHESNVSLDTANKNRCRAYPSSPECK